MARVNSSWATTRSGGVKFSPKVACHSCKHGFGKRRQVSRPDFRVRAITGEQVVISNKNLLDKELHNMARLNRRRIVQVIGLVYQTPPEVCARIPEIG